MTRPFESETIIFVEKFTSLKQQLEIVWWLNKSTQNFFGGKKSGIVSNSVSQNF